MDEREYAPPTEEYQYPHSYPDVKTLLAWSAPGRPFRKKGKEFFFAGLVIAFLVEIILFLFALYMPMLVVATLVFMWVVLSTVPPANFSYKITTEGIKIEDHFYIWAEVYDFYFKKIDQEDTLIITTQAFIPGELHMPLGTMSRDHARRVLLHFLPFREVVRPTFLEKSADWLSKTFPLESPHSHSNV